MECEYVRPYVLTGGRVRPAVGPVSHVVASSASCGFSTPEHRRIVELVTVPTSVAEVASRLDLALSVVRIMLGDLIEEGLISVHEPARTAALRPASSAQAGDGPDRSMLEAVIDVLRAL